IKNFSYVVGPVFVAFIGALEEEAVLSLQMGPLDIDHEVVQRLDVTIFNYGENYSQPQVGEMVHGLDIAHSARKLEKSVGAPNPVFELEARLGKILITAGVLALQSSAQHVVKRFNDVDF